ncbi:MAG: SDR family NAD(P)-dependent oxidoreductase [Gammaproteobacteria bacterium]
MTTQRLNGKTAVITGASGGIGRAIARLFAEHGARLVVSYARSPEKADALVKELGAAGAEALAVRADVARPAEVERLTAQALEALGRIDIWANIAGMDILTGEGARLGDREKLERLLDVDLKGTIYCCWCVAPLMKAAGGGVILNMSWDHALHGMKGRNPEMFAAAKAGVQGFSKCLALSYAPEVRVNDLAPGWIETTFAREVMSKAAYCAVVERTPLGRFGTPEDVARAALYLASDEAAFISGQTLRVNGGLPGG